MGDGGIWYGAKYSQNMWEWFARQALKIDFFNEKLVWGVLSLPKGKESTPQTEKKTEIHPKSTPHPPKHIILGWARGPGVDLGNMEGYRAW